MYLRQSNQERADGSVLSHLQIAESVWNIGYGFRIDSTFYLNYESETDGFRKDFDLDLDEFYRRDVFDIDNLRDLDTDSLKRLDEMLEDEGPLVWYPSMITNAVSITLMEDGAYTCRKPVLL